MDDPYKVLGLGRDASAEDIRKAYRALAKRWHPDTNPDKPQAAERFKAVSAAHALLSDPEQRARYDRGEIDASGQERAPSPRGPAGGWRDFAEAPGGARYRRAAGPNDDPFAAFGEAGGFEAEDLEEFLSRAFARGGAEGARAPRRGRDIRASLRLPFLDAARGAVREVALPDGRAVALSIPEGAEDGTVLRLAGQGRAGEPPGDLLVELEVEPHPLFRREGDDILLDLPVTLKEAVLGARVEVPTLRGPVALAIPPRSREGARLRLRGRGVRGGNQIVILRPVALPEGEEPELEEFLRRWTPRDRRDPRAGMGGGVP